MFLEMRFCDVSEVPEKSVFTRLFDLFASAMLANFQARSSQLLYADGRDKYCEIGSGKQRALYFVLLILPHFPLFVKYFTKKLRRLIAKARD